MAKTKYIWVDKGVLSFEGKIYKKNDIVPDVGKKAISSLLKKGKIIKQLLGDDK